MDSEKDKECFSYEYIVPESSGGFRVQYGFNTGARDAEGNTCPKMSESLRPLWQGSVVLKSSQELRFGMDMTQHRCSGETCPSIPFRKIK
jgi:hypothetical protein